MKKCSGCRKKKRTETVQKSKPTEQRNKIVSIFNKKEKASSKKTTL